MKNFFFAVFFIFPFLGHSQETPYEKSGRTLTATWEEAITHYKSLETAWPGKAKLTESGTSDAGKPLHLFIISSGGDFDPEKIKRSGKRIVLINNAIHPGEPEGVDASMMLARDLLAEPAYVSLLENVVILIIPMYNVGGALNRGCCYRANQNGPTPHGFRGNSRNLDLNRDFAKSDSREAQLFNKVMTTFNPDIFIDTHTTDGSDYPYVITVIPTQKDKARPAIAQYMQKILMPDLYTKMKEAGFELAPYVNTVSEFPDSGIADFFDSPRYATGYANLYNCIGITTETHMLKSFDQRVEATYQFLLAIAKLTGRDKVQIARARTEAGKDLDQQNAFPLHWELNTKQHDWFLFKGYEASKKAGAVTGKEHAVYDQASPWERKIPYFNSYIPSDTVNAPVAYIIPQAWHEAITRLQANNVKMQTLTADLELEMEVYYIDDYKTTPNAYEGHYLHYEIKTRTEKQKIWFHKGDVVIYLNQPAKRYLVEMLEPRAEDSYFAWNFFDEILMQKEYFSTWLFEDKAAEILAGDPALKARFEEQKTKDADFAANGRKQLDFIYKNSPWYEKSHLRYPVGRLLKEQKMSLSK